MAKKPSGPKTTSTTASVELDGQHLVQALQRAGMDPAKLNLREILGSRVDIQELQSRLQRPTPDVEWHFHVSVSPK